MSLECYYAYGLQLLWVNQSKDAKPLLILACFQQYWYSYHSFWLGCVSLIDQISFLVPCYASSTYHIYTFIYLCIYIHTYTYICIYMYVYVCMNVDDTDI